MQTYLGWKQVHEICRLFHSLCPNEQNMNLQQLKSFLTLKNNPGTVAEPRLYLGLNMSPLKSS